jgi:alkanesulfonate monooxygenase SsuD/methylene tetrahydromethanopterin reductase-like flavin-dependent oxidoreductase (luciferase family)
MKLSFLSMTSYDGPAPSMEIWPVAPRICDPEVARQSVQRWLGLCERAEALGFDWISVAEHHYAAYMMTPNPMIMAAALTQVIKKATIALLGPLVPLSNPVRLAEEIAMLDALSGGRLAVLFLRGTQNEHNTYDTPKNVTREMTQEGIDLAVKALTADEPFSWNGTHYKFSTVSVWPRPNQNPGVPIYASGNSEESVAFAAKRRLGIAFSFSPPEMVKKFVDLYKQEAAAAGWTPTPDHVIYRGLTYVAATDEQAQGEAFAYFGARAAESAHLQSSTMGGPEVTPLITQPYFLGSPQTLIERFAALRECGVGVADLCFAIGTHEQQIKAMETVAREVMPVVKSW